MGWGDLDYRANECIIRPPDALEVGVEGDAYLTAKIVERFQKTSSSFTIEGEHTLSYKRIDVFDPGGCLLYTSPSPRD